MAKIQQRRTPEGSGLDGFHPAVQAWFETTFDGPTPAQSAAWPRIKARSNVLIAAPTGSGKTLAAFLAGIDTLVQAGVDQRLPTKTQVLYVSPLKALSTDVRRNLEAPLAGICAQLQADGVACEPITAGVRTGDTTPAARARMKKQPPHILVTTPESLYILLTSDAGRSMLTAVETVIVDEIHALAASKRGAHLLLSLARLDALCEVPPVRIGLSATQKPIDAMARFLCGERACEIIDTGHVRARDLALCVPDSPLTAVMPGEVWSEIYVQLEALIRTHKTTLIFVNTRRLAERLARHLSERLGETAVTAHHGSLAKEHRFDAEQRLKSGGLKALVATASLELGIDIGDIDLVCQLGSPRSIAGFLQRVGRSGHAVHACPKGRLFPLSLDDLVECAALLDAVHRDELDLIVTPYLPLDVLAQQIVAEVACRQWDEKELYSLFRETQPYRALTEETFAAVVGMLAEGFSTRRGRRGAHLHRDVINGVLRGRRGARLTALTNGGTIPDQFDYEVRLRPQDLRIGSVNEDFAFESLAGDIFQLGNASYRILKVETGRVYVEDAHGLPPNIPFWFGEAPGRSDALSMAVSRLRVQAETLLGQACSLPAWLTDLGLPAPAVEQLSDYFGKAYAALGVLPSHDCLVLERFFDATGDMHLVIHSTYGSRVNRALGLSLRKRFCRKFNFELQASALEDSLVLSLGPTHSFAMDEVLGYLNAATVREVLIQALLDAPMFATRWRWVASIGLAVRRMSGGARRPPQFQRSEAEDLIAVIFPEQLACLENISGAREIPEHPLVGQAIHDCLHEVMDVVGLERLLRRIERGDMRLESRELVHPSPLAQGILNARPYAFLDDGAAEERRTNNVRSLAHISLSEAGALASLDPEAVRQVREQAWLDARDSDELHDGLMLAGFVTLAEVDAAQGKGRGWHAMLEQLADAGRAASVVTASGARWCATERLHELIALYPSADIAALPDPIATVPEREIALVSLLRSRLEVLGPVSLQQLLDHFDVVAADMGVALVTLEGEGGIMRGQFQGGGEQWCDRGLLARIHRLTLSGRRQSYRPVDVASFMRFLFQWQGVDAREGRGGPALEAVLERLEGCVASASVWEREILPARMESYHPHWLDELCATGRYGWWRLRKHETVGKKGAQVVSQTPIAILPRTHLRFWLADESAIVPESLSVNGGRLLVALQAHGASFAGELTNETGLLETQLEQALGELVACGAVNADAFHGIRYLTTKARDRARRARYRRRGYPAVGIEHAGRWSLVRPMGQIDRWVRCEHLVRTLLRRYGVLFRALVAIEPGLAPWRDLLYICRRLEARGEVAGGRFVEGFSGEQFALIEATKRLRRVRDEAANEMQVLSAADPLNLTGRLLSGERVPALPGNRIAFLGGQPRAALIAGEVHALDGVEVDWTLRQRLVQAPRVAMPGASTIAASRPRLRW